MLRLYQASLAGDLVAMASMLAEGAEVNGSVGEEEGRTPLIGAAIGVSVHKEEEILVKTPFIDYYLLTTLLTSSLLSVLVTVMLFLHTEPLER